MKEDYNFVLTSWRNEKRPIYFSKMIDALSYASNNPISENDVPTLMAIMHEIISNLELINKLKKDGECDLILSNENLSNLEESETIVGEKIADLIFNHLLLPNNAPTIEKSITQLLEISLMIYDEGLSEEIDDIAVVFEKIGNYLVLQKRDKESVVLLEAMKDRDYFDNYAYCNSHKTFDGLLYLALEKENDTLGCLVTEAFENLCGMYEDYWERFIPFMLQMRGDEIEMYDFNPEVYDKDFLNAIRNTKYEKIIFGESPNMDGIDEEEEIEEEDYNTESEISVTNDKPKSRNDGQSNSKNNIHSVSINQEKLSSIPNINSRLRKSEAENKRYVKKAGKLKLNSKTTSRSKSYRPKGIKGHFYGLYRLLKRKNKSKR